MHASPQIIFEQVYDKYSAMVYGLALKITDSQQDAAEVLVNTFINLQKENLIEDNAHCICATLIKLTVKTAGENKNNVKSSIDLKLKEFEQTTYLYKLFCEDTQRSYIIKKLPTQKSLSYFWYNITHLFSHA